MKWKKVSEHPLPDVMEYDPKYYLVKYKDNLSDSVYYRFVDDGLFVNTGKIIEWCEFNPDQIEPTDSNQEVKNPCSYCGGEIDNELRVDRFINSVLKSVESGMIKVESMTSFAYDLKNAVDVLRGVVEL